MSVTGVRSNRAAKEGPNRSRQATFGCDQGSPREKHHASLLEGSVLSSE